MLERYLDIQQRKLEQVGQERSRVYQVWESEQQKLEQLQECLTGLLPNRDFHSSLQLLNKSGMQRQLQMLTEHQQHQVAMAEADVLHQDNLMRRQVGWTKGVEVVLDKRNQRQAYKAARQEQANLDELSCQAYLRQK